MKISALAAAVFFTGIAASLLLPRIVRAEDSLDFDPLGANREFRSENFSGTLADPNLPTASEMLSSQRAARKNQEKPSAPDNRSQAGRKPGQQQGARPEKPRTPSETPAKPNPARENAARKPEPEQSRTPEPARRDDAGTQGEAPRTGKQDGKPRSQASRPLTDQEIRERTARDMKGTFIRRIPGQEMYVIIKNPAAKNPKLQFADSSGRFAIFNGELYDLWDNQKKLNTPALIDYAFTHIPLDSLRKASGLNEIVLPAKNSGGINKGREVFIFADPRDTGTVQLLKDITDNINSAYYMIRIILLNSTGDSNTEKLLHDFACSNATAKEKALSILKQDFKVVFQTAKQCKADDRMQRNRELAATLGVRKLPFLVTPSGRYAEGAIDEPFDYIQNIRK